MKSLRLIFFVLLTFPVAISACAQIGAYAGFSAAKSNLGQQLESGNWLHGGVIGAYIDSRHFVVLELGIDARAVFLDQTDRPGFIHDRLDGGFIGPRVAVHVPALPLRPYGEALIGVAVTQGVRNSNLSFPSVNESSFAYQLIAGADLTVLPHIDWRVAEFTYTGIPNLKNGALSTTAYTKAISTGLVVRF